MTIHVTCAQAPSNVANGNLAVDPGALDWSQTLSSPGATAKVAPGGTAARSVITVVTIDAAAWVAVGAAPDPSKDPRRYIPAGCSQPFAVEAGDKVAWAAYP